MLIDSGLPHKFWAEALSTACYLKNRSPARALHHMTPYQAFTGIKPNVQHFRVCGCVCYAHIPRDERKKLDSKAIKCIFLGYGSDVKGYRLYDLAKERMLYSRNVIFNEEQHDVQKEKFKLEFETPIIEASHPPDSASEDDENEQPEATVRQSVRVKRPPDMHGEWVSVAHETNEPPSFTEALMGCEKDDWINAMNEVFHESLVWIMTKHFVLL